MSHCIICHKVIKSNRRGVKYCSKACKQKAYYNRKQGNFNGDQGRGYYQYSFDLLEQINDFLKGCNYEMPYYEYCYIRACHPHISQPDQVVKVVIEFYLHNRAFKPKTSYLRSLSEFKNRFNTEISKNISW